MQWSKFNLAFLLTGLFVAACSSSSTEPEDQVNIIFNAKAFDFGDVPIGTIKDDSLVVTNDANSTSGLGGNISITGAGFALMDQNLTFNLGVGKSKTFHIRFSPEDPQAFSGTISITHTAGNESSPLEISLSGTGGDNSSTIQAAIAAGWQAFENGDYPAAFAQFDSAIALASVSPHYAALGAEATSGKGWAKAYNREFSDARALLASAATDANADATTKNDANAGLALVYLALNDFDNAISRSFAVLSGASSYQFAHDGRIDNARLRLVLAQAYFSVGDYNNAASQLDRIDPNNAPHPTDPAILLGLIQAQWGT